jgi:hypothetical protein
MIKPKPVSTKQRVNTHFLTAQQGRRTFTVVTPYSDAHACDQKLCTDVVAVEVLQTAKIRKKVTDIKVKNIANMNM